MSGQKQMLRTMFTDNILYTTAKLHSHQWIMGAMKEDYRGLCGRERWNIIHEDLSRYSEPCRFQTPTFYRRTPNNQIAQAIKDYEFWLTCSIQNPGLDRNSLPPNYQTWGRSLAIIELASNSSTRSLFTSDERRLLARMEQNFIAENNAWRENNAHARLSKKFGVEVKARFQLHRNLLAAIGGFAAVGLVLVVLLGNFIFSLFLLPSLES